MNSYTRNSNRNLRTFTVSLLAYLLLTSQLAPLAVAANAKANRARTPIGVSNKRSGAAESASSPASNRIQFAPEPKHLAAPIPVPNGSPGVVTIVATKTDNRPSPDPMVANPGDTINYTAIISNTGTAAATGVLFNDDVDANTAVVNGSVKMSPLAFSDNYNGVLNTQLIVAADQGVLANDTGLPAPTATAISNGPTTQGGAVTLNSDGSFTYTPPANFAGGSDTFIYTATNGQPPNDTATVTITIPCQTINVTNPANSSGTANAAFSETFTQSGAVGTATFTLSSGSLPAGLTLATNGVLSGTPTQTGSFPIVVTVTDANGCTGTGATYTLVIGCQTITVTNPANSNGTASAAFSETFTQSGAIGTATFTTASALPAGLTLATNGVLSGTPTQTGSFAIVVTVTDANGCTGAGATYTLVIGCQTTTVTNPANSNGTASAAFSETFTQSGAIGTPTFTTASALPAGLTLATNGVLSGTPIETGSFPIVVTITDANGCTGTGATYTLVIGCQTITVTNPANSTGDADAPFSETFTQSGAIGGATFTLASGSLPAGLTLATNGVLSGTPIETGSFPIVVTVTDANGCTGTGATYTLVIGCQTITVTNPANSTGDADAPFSETFTQSGAIGGATFTLASGSLPAGLTLATNGVLSGTPIETGSFPIVVTVTDANGCTGTGATYTLVIGCQTINVTNPANSSGTANAAFSETFTQSGAIGTATFTTASALPGGLTLATNGVLSGTPTQTGSFPIVVTVTDANGCTGTGATYTLVIGCQTITVTNPANSNGTASAAFSETFTQSGAIGTPTFTTASALPAGLTLATNGVLSGTPTQTGSFPIVVTVTDANGCTGTGATYTLVIGCQTITVTNPANSNGTASVAFSETFTQSGAIGTATFTTASALPAGLTLATNGVLSGTPTEAGSFPIVVTVTDANGCTGTGATYTLVIGCQTITVTNPANSSGTANAAFSETFTQSGAIGTATFTLSSGTLPGGLTLATNGVLSGTPTEAGSFPIVVTVTDANDCTGTGATYNLAIDPGALSVKKSITPLVANFPITIGTLQPGKSVTITFSVTVNNPLPSGTTQVSNQGTVSGGNFANVLTDDPDTGTANDPTITGITPDIAARDAREAEPAAGQTNMYFTVTLSAPAPGPVSVDFTTVDETPGSGKAMGGGVCGVGVDYVTTFGNLGFSAGQQVQAIPVPVCSDADVEPSETFLLRLSNAVGGNIVRGQLGNEAVGTITPNTPGTFLISELRTSGPGGVGDDFVEFYNNTDTPLTVAASDASAGYGIFKLGADCGTTPILVATIPNGTVIPARGHYLVVGSQYSLTAYAAGDTTMTSDIESDRNVGVFSTADIGAISSLNRNDVVGFDLNPGGNICALMREGTPLASAGGSTSQHSFVRKQATGTLQDTNDNAADFVIVSTDSSVAVGSNAAPILGAPGPENLASPIQRNATVKASLIDTAVASSAPPNRVRDNVAYSDTLTPSAPNGLAPATNPYTLGTLVIRRKFTNNTGANVTRLRFRIVDITTTNSPGAGLADVRALSSLTGSVATTCCGTVNVLGITLEQPPTQARGGGLNSSMAAGTVTVGTPIANGASVNLNFLLGVASGGTFRFFINVEALP